MRLRPGWQLLYDSCVAVIDMMTGQDPYPDQDTIRKFFAQLECRKQEKIPARQVSTICQAIIQASIHLGPIFHDDIVYFLTKHLDGSKQIQGYLDQLDENWAIHFCSTCRRYHITRTQTTAKNCLIFSQTTKKQLPPFIILKYQIHRPIYTN